MNYTSDRNEPARRQLALLLAITIHVALGIGLFLAADSAPTSKAAAAKTEAAPKPVLQP